MKILNDVIEKTRVPINFKEDVVSFEEKLSKVPGAIISKGADDGRLCPLKHTFVDGAYVREIFMPKGTLLTSKIHKIKHPYFVMKGKCSVLTEKGVQVIEAPYQGITEAGTKRVLYIHEDTTWVCVHTNPDNDKDLSNIEKRIISKNFNDLALSQDDMLKLTKGV